MMKFVYVIVGSEENFVIEQALLSIHTLRKHNATAHISILIDEATYNLLKKYKSPVLNYADEILIPPIPQGLLPEQRSRYLKTSLRGHVRGKLLYIDNDTIIGAHLKELEEMKYDVAAVSNRHGFYDKLKTHPMLEIYYMVTRKKPAIDFKITQFVNGGIIFSNDTKKALDFFDTWHNLWWDSSTKRGYHKDQPDMWRANALHGNIIQELEGTYNCQLIYPEISLKYVINARIMHYFSSTPIFKDFPLKQQKFLEGIRANGISPDVEKIIDNIKNVYLSLVRGMSDDEAVLYYSPIVILAKKLSRDIPFTNKIAQAIYRIFGYKI